MVGHIARIFGFSALLVVAGNPAYAQDAPAFEVASITPCEPGTPEPAGQSGGMVRFVFPGGRFQANAVTVQFLFEWAYGIQPFQHSGGPSWFNSDRYDVIAKAGGSATEPRIKLMLRALLSERFRLQFHRESKSLPAYVISLGKAAPKLSVPKDDETYSLQITPRTDPDTRMVSYHVVATRYSLAQLTDIFARQLGRVIVNNTGFDGDLDFTLDLSPDENRPNPLDPSIIITALREQLGLAVKAQNASVEFLVIDYAEKVAAGN